MLCIITCAMHVRSGISHPKNTPTLTPSGPEEWRLYSGTREATDEDVLCTGGLKGGLTETFTHSEAGGTDARAQHSEQSIEVTSRTAGLGEALSLVTENKEHYI